VAGITKRASPRNPLQSARGSIGLRRRGRVCKLWSVTDETFDAVRRKFGKGYLQRGLSRRR